MAQIIRSIDDVVEPDIHYTHNDIFTMLTKIIPIRIDHVEANIYNVIFLADATNEKGPYSFKIYLTIVTDNDNMIRSNELYSENLDKYRKDISTKIEESQYYNYITDFNMSFDKDRKLFYTELVDSNKAIVNAYMSKSLFIDVSLMLISLIKDDILFLNIFTDKMYEYIFESNLSIKDIPQENSRMFAHGDSIYIVFKDEKLDMVSYIEKKIPSVRRNENG